MSFIVSKKESLISSEIALNRRKRIDDIRRSLYVEYQTPSDSEHFHMHIGNSFDHTNGPAAPARSAGRLLCVICGTRRRLLN